MLTVEQVDSLFHESILPCRALELPLETTSRLITNTDIVADRDLPPFDRVAMDGIAIYFDSWKNGQRSFQISHLQKAGQPSSQLTNLAECIEVMTGAILPHSCDCVVRYEDITITHSFATMSDNLILEKWQNVHKQGSDRKHGEILVAKSTAMNAPVMAIAASVGHEKILTNRGFSIAVISTGDELVDVGSKPEPYQIRRSNSYGIVQLVNDFSLGSAIQFHIKDEEHILNDQIKKIIDSFDILILSGGVSMGKFDLVPKVLKSLGAQEIFHKIAQKPGKPMWYGLSSTKKPIFALPGNPVSALVCMRRYVITKLQKELKYAEPNLFVRLGHQFKNLKDMTHFVPVTITSQNDGLLVANEVHTNGSGDFSSLGLSHGFVELPPSSEKYQTGFVAKFWRWKPW